MKSKILPWILFFLTGTIIGMLVFLPLILTRRIVIKGKKNLRGQKFRNVLFVSNHPSYLETVIIPFATLWPNKFLNPLTCVPWQTPDVKILERISLLRFMRCIPVHDIMGNREDPWVYREIKKVLRNGSVLIFPEGTRSGKAVDKKNVLLYTKNHIPMGNPRLGIGELIRTSDPIIIPILVKGAEKVMPIGKPIPKFHKSRVEIIFGVPKKSDHPPDEVLLQHRHAIRRWYAEQAMKRVAELDE